MATLTSSALATQASGRRLPMATADFPTSNFVLPNFGYGTIVLAISRNDFVTGSRGIWRSTDGGDSWMQVLPIAGHDDIGQLQWAPGSDHLVYAAVGRGLAISKDAGATFQMVAPWGNGPGNRVNHVAVWQNEGADPFPSMIYALGDSTMFLSFDGGVTWTKMKPASRRRSVSSRIDSEFQHADRDGDLAALSAVHLCG